MLRTIPLILLLLLMATGCASPTVYIDGTKVTYDEGAAIVLKQGQDALAAGDRNKAQAKFNEVLNQFGRSEEAVYALDALAKMAFEDAGCAASKRYDERLLGGGVPRSVAERARQRQQGCGAVVASPSLSRFEENFERASTPAARREVATQAVNVANEEGNYRQAVQWLLKLLANTNEPSARQAVEQRVVEQIDGKLSATDLRLLSDALSGTAFPAAEVTSKLALLLEHAGNINGARAAYQKYVQTWPTTPFAQRAQARLANLDTRLAVNPRTIGVLLPLSGRRKTLGRQALAAIRLALRLRGKSLQTKDGLRLVVQDSKGTAVGAADGVDALVMKHGVQVVLGPIFNDEAQGAAFRAQALAVPLLTIAREEKLPEIGPFVFRNTVTNGDQVKALVTYAMGVMGMRRFAILYPRHPYGEELLHLFWDEVVQRGGEIRGVEAYDATATTFTNQVRRLVARYDLERRADYNRAVRRCDNEPDEYRQERCKSQVGKELPPIIDFEGLFIPHFPPKISMVSAAVAAEDIIVERDPGQLRRIEKTLGRKVEPVTLLGASGWNSYQVVKRSGRTVENSVFTDGFFADSADETSRAFVEAHQTAFNRPPRMFPEALIYDSAKLLAQVLAANPTTREAVQQGLRAVRDFQGVTGVTSFGGKNDADRPIRILTIKESKIEEVATTPVNAQPGRPKTN